MGADGPYELQSGNCRGPRIVCGSRTPSLPVPSALWTHQVEALNALTKAMEKNLEKTKQVRPLLQEIASTQFSVNTLVTL